MEASFRERLAIPRAAVVRNIKTYASRNGLD